MYGDDVLGQIGKQIKSVDEKHITVRLATVISNDGADPTQTLVILDNDLADRPVSALSVAGSFVVGTRVACLAYPPRGLIVLGSLDGRFRSPVTGDANLTSVGHGFQVGASTGLNVILDNNEIMARNNGLAAQLALNNDGGNISMFGSSPVGVNPDLIVGGDGDIELRMNVNQLRALANGVPSTLFLNFSGGAVNIGETAGYVSTPMRHRSSLDNNTRSTSSTSFVLASSTASVSFAAPPSGAITLMVSADISNSGSNNSRLSYNIAHGGADVSGSDLRAALINGTVPTTGHVTMFHSGLSGTVTVTPRFRATAGTASFDNIKITVIPSP